MSDDLKERLKDMNQFIVRKGLGNLLTCEGSKEFLKENFALLGIEYVGVNPKYFLTTTP